MTPILEYIMSGTEPSDPRKAEIVRRRTSSYSVINRVLYKRSFTVPLLKCIEGEQADYVLAEIHEGICGQHLGGRSLARKVLRAGYYWPTVEVDAKNYVKKCQKYQIHADVHLAPPTELSSISSPWPFATCGIDLLGPFLSAPGQFKYLIVAMDYFTKWIEA